MISEVGSVTPLMADLSLSGKADEPAPTKTTEQEAQHLDKDKAKAREEQFNANVQNGVVVEIVKQLIDAAIEKSQKKRAAEIEICCSKEYQANSVIAKVLFQGLKVTPKENNGCQEMLQFVTTTLHELDKEDNVKRRLRFIFLDLFNMGCSSKEIFENPSEYAKNTGVCGDTAPAQSHRIYSRQIQNSLQFHPFRQLAICLFSERLQELGHYINIADKQNNPKFKASLEFAAFITALHVLSPQHVIGLQDACPATWYKEHLG